eukprot:TRINITY_DN4921_c0_g2_i8.p1 TRINITY_DN4921_c0_g2~~TRINITY_DN4921_c0_g2_i8.p1  ORF type:complete len:973 (+),score=162.40 TRINITY_DN4921_c0_g2_i8:616-3534(+)
MPFYRMLRTELIGVETRALHEYSPQERMPPQSKLLDFINTCKRLTTEWYGRPNLSLLYEWFQEASNYSGEARYLFAELSSKRSPDGFLKALDGQLRKALYSDGTNLSEEARMKKKKIFRKDLREKIQQLKKAENHDEDMYSDDDEQRGSNVVPDEYADGDEGREGKHQPRRHSLHPVCDSHDDDVEQSYDDVELDRCGRSRSPIPELPVHQVGESPIDNTVLPNVMTPVESKVLLASGMIRQMLVRKVKLRQMNLLQKIGYELGEDLLGAPPSRVRTVLSALTKGHVPPPLLVIEDGMSDTGHRCESVRGDGPRGDASQMSSVTATNRSSISNSTPNVATASVDEDGDFVQLRKCATSPAGLFNLPPQPPPESQTHGDQPLPSTSSTAELSPPRPISRHRRSKSQDFYRASLHPREALSGRQSRSLSSRRRAAIRAYHNEKLGGGGVAVGGMAGGGSAVGSVDGDGDGTGMFTLAQFDIDPTNMSYRMLLRQGHVVRSWGQLSRQEKDKINHYIASELMGRSSLKRGAALGAAAAATSTTAERTPLQSKMEQFVEFTRNHPGSIFAGDREEHKKLLLLGMWTNNISVVKRSCMETMTVHRYLPIEWTREVTLWTIDESGQECALRRNGDKEFSRIRKNAYPYAESHGMGITTGGVVEGEQEHGSLLYDLGAVAASDPEGKLSNWYCNDIEKVVQEVYLLNPSAEDDLLPGEAYHIVGQNPKQGSSIGETQHTQIWRGDTRDWPLMTLENRAMYCREIGAYIDLVQVGEECDAFYVKLRTRNPANPALVEHLQDLRLLLLRHFGGRLIDFCVSALPQGGNGWFVIAFAPISMIEKFDTGIAQNVDTGMTNVDMNLPMAKNLDSSSFLGQLTVENDSHWWIVSEGRAALSRLFDFTRKPGARRIVREFLLYRFAYVDHSGQCLRIESESVNLGPISDTPKEPVFDVLMDLSTKYSYLDVDNASSSDRGSIDDVH